MTFKKGNYEMKYTIGDEVRYIHTGQIGTIVGIVYYDGTDDVYLYHVLIDGFEYSVEPEELS